MTTVAWIQTVEPEAADDELRAIYDRVITSRGKLSDIMRAQSLAPRAMAAHLDLYLALLFGRSPLSRAERETIAVAVSVENRCAYCVQHHRVALEAHLRDPDAVDKLVRDPSHSGLGPRRQAMIDYAVKLSRATSGMEESDIHALRDSGLSDEEILNVNLIASYFNYVNRIVSGLGISPRPEEVAGYHYA